MATTTSAMTPVALQPTRRRQGPMTCAPMTLGRDASSIITLMMGSAITPLHTAAQNSSATGSSGVKHSATPPMVAAPMIA